MHSRNNLNQGQGYRGLVDQGMHDNQEYPIGIMTYCHGYYPFGSKATRFNTKHRFFVKSFLLVTCLFFCIIQICHQYLYIYKICVLHILSHFCKELEEPVMNHHLFFFYQSCDIEKLVKFFQKFRNLHYKEFPLKVTKLVEKFNTDHNDGLHLRDIAHNKSFEQL